MMSQFYFKVDSITNPLEKGPGVSEKKFLEDIGAFRDGTRQDGFFLDGDRVSGRLITARYKDRPDGKSLGPFLADVGFPYRVDMEVDISAVDEGTAALLCGLVQALRPEVVFETGTHKGRSAKAIAEALVKNGSGHLTTVDMTDFGCLPLALTEEEMARVTQVIGVTPGVLFEEPLASIRDIDFAHLDGAHDETILDELRFVEERCAMECTVVIDNAADGSFKEMREALNSYKKNPRLTLNTCCGTEVVTIYRRKHHGAPEKSNGEKVSGEESGTKGGGERRPLPRAEAAEPAG